MLLLILYQKLSIDLSITSSFVVQQNAEYTIKQAHAPEFIRHDIVGLYCTSFIFNYTVHSSKHTATVTGPPTGVFIC